MKWGVWLIRQGSTTLSSGPQIDRVCRGPADCEKRPRCCLLLRRARSFMAP